MNNMLSMDKRLEIWEASLPQDKLVLLTYAVKKEMDNLNDMINKSMDTCYAAAIADETELGVKEIRKIINKAYFYMNDVKKCYEEDIDIMTKVERFEEDVKQFLRKEMAAGTLKSKAMVKAKKKFGIPAKDISNLWLIVKEEDNGPGEKLSSEEQKKKQSETMKKKMAEKKEENKAHTEKETSKDVIAQQEEKGQTESASEPQKKEIKSTLVEVTEVRKFIGKFGSYEKASDGTVKAGEIKFNNLAEVEESKATVEEDIKKMREEFEKTVAEKREKAFGKLEEVKQLLSM